MICNHLSGIITNQFSPSRFQTVPFWEKGTSTDSRLLLIVFVSVGSLSECVSERMHAQKLVTGGIHNSAVTAGICGPDMVEWLLGELLPLSFSFIEAIFHSNGVLKVKQYTWANSHSFQPNKEILMAITIVCLCMLCDCTNYLTNIFFTLTSARLKVSLTQEQKSSTNNKRLCQVDDGA